MSSSPAIISRPTGNGDDAELGGNVQPARSAAGLQEIRRRRRSRRRSDAIRPNSEPTRAAHRLPGGAEDAERERCFTGLSMASDFMEISLALAMNTARVVPRHALVMPGPRIPRAGHWVYAIVACAGLQRQPTWRRCWLRRRCRAGQNRYRRQIGAKVDGEARSSVTARKHCR